MRRGESGYFDPIQIVVEPIETYLPKEDPKIKSEDAYASLVKWVVERQKPPVAIELPPPPLETDAMLKSQLQIKSVVYNPLFPLRSGAHVLVSGIPRYFQSGDGEQLSSKLDFVLADVKETTPDQGYILIFQKSDGKKVELPYTKSNR